MSARTDGQSLWFVRPLELVDGAVWVPLDNEGHLFVGSRSAMVAHIADLHRTTGRQHAAREVE